MNTCEWHGCSEPARRKYCSDKCKSKAGVDRFRKNLKTKAIEYKGGRCERCGYDKSPRSLVFHHRDPAEKDFAIGGNGHSRAWDRVKIGLDKCDLLCANCHGEVHEQWEQE